MPDARRNGFVLFRVMSILCCSTVSCQTIGSLSFEERGIVPLGNTDKIVVEHGQKEN